MAAEEVDVVGRFLADKLGERRRSRRERRSRRPSTRKLQELARTAVERGLEDLDARQGFRGPSGHLTGKALDKQRRELAKAYSKFLKGSEIVEGIVMRFEKDATSPKPEAKIGKLFLDVGAGVGAGGARRGRRRSAGKGKLAPEAEGAARRHRCRRRAARASSTSASSPATRRGPKPLADRFKPGDLVRVRLATDRPHDEDGPLPLALELGPQAAMVVMDPQTREVLALVGGYDYHAGGFDRVAARAPPAGVGVQADRSTRRRSRRTGITPATILNDAPEVYDLWKPQNYEKEEFRGPVRVRTALAHSINTVAIKVLSDVGLDQARAFATRIGHDVADPGRRGAVAGARLAGGHAARAGQRLRHLRERRHRRPAGARSARSAASRSRRRPLAPALKPEVAYVMTRSCAA